MGKDLNSSYTLDLNVSLKFLINKTVKLGGEGGGGVGRKEGGGGQWGEMNQSLYAHMNKKKKNC
jgi:hypothetical protein